MKKILQIGWKDLRVIFRDRAALILMLLAPFAMTIGLGLVTGTLGGQFQRPEPDSCDCGQPGSKHPGECPG